MALLGGTADGQNATNSDPPGDGGLAIGQGAVADGENQLH
jgi:hypothetical protein